MKEYTGFLNGWLCKVGDDPMSTSPTLCRSWCPTEMLERDARAMGIEEGWPMSGHYSSGFAIKRPDGYFVRGGNGEILSVQLPLRGKTQYFRTDTVEVLKPKGIRKGVETRWQCGRWEKYSKREGWIPA